MIGLNWEGVGKREFPVRGDPQGLEGGSPIERSEASSEIPAPRHQMTVNKDI